MKVLIIAISIALFVMTTYTFTIPAEMSQQSTTQALVEKKGCIDNESLNFANHRFKEMTFLLAFLLLIAMTWALEHYAFECINLRIRNWWNNRKLKKKFKLFNKGQINEEELFQGNLNRSIFKAHFGKAEGITEIKNIIENHILDDNAIKDLLKVAMKYSPSEASFQHFMLIICDSIKASRLNNKRRSPEETVPNNTEPVTPIAETKAKIEPEKLTIKDIMISLTPKQLWSIILIFISILAAVATFSIKVAPLFTQK